MIKKLIPAPINGKDVQLTDFMDSVCNVMEENNNRYERIHVISLYGNLFQLCEDNHAMQIYGKLDMSCMKEITDFFHANKKEYGHDATMADVCRDMDDGSVYEYFVYNGSVFKAEYKEYPGNKSNHGVWKCLLKNPDKPFEYTCDRLSIEMSAGNFNNDCTTLCYCYRVGDDIHFEFFYKPEESFN